MTLATITALINSKIRNKTPKVLKVEHADVEQAIVNEIYQDYKLEQITNGIDAPSNTIISVVTGSSSSSYEFFLYFKISGKSCHVKGYFRIATTGTYYGQPLFFFTNSLYNPKIDIIPPIVAISEAGNVIRIRRVLNEMLSFGSLIPYDTYYIDSTYEIEN